MSHDFQIFSLQNFSIISLQLFGTLYYYFRWNLRLSHKRIREAFVCDCIFFTCSIFKSDVLSISRIISIEISISNNTVPALWFHQLPSACHGVLDALLDALLVLKYLAISQISRLQMHSRFGIIIVLLNINFFDILFHASKL